MAKNAGKKQGRPTILELAREKFGGSKEMERAAFLELKDEIQDALDNRLKMKQIWEILQENKLLNVSYSSFRRYCAAEGLKMPPKIRDDVKMRPEPESSVRSKTATDSDVAPNGNKSVKPVPSSDDEEDLVG